MQSYSSIISKELGIPENQVAAVLKLLSEGCTIPFISRYRKEATGSLNEVQVSDISDKNDKLCEIEKRKQTILSTIEEQGKLTPELKKRIDDSWNITELEDIYAPYKPKRKTRAEVARQHGLEPLAMFIMKQSYENITAKAKSYVDKSKGVETIEDALQGAMDIIAETVSEDERARNTIRNNFNYDAVISSHVIKGKEEEGLKYRDYFDFSEPLKRCASHRLLAIRRGESEGILKVHINGDDTRCLNRLTHLFVRNQSEAAQYVNEAVNDSFKRLLKPQIETEFAASSKEKADQEAIKIFVKNLEQLLMSPPLGQKRVLAIDPGFRTGCKVVCLDSEGNLLHNETIYPHPPKNEYMKASAKIWALVEQYKIEAISIGDGTASRETEKFIQDLGLSDDIQVYTVSEDGASIYSASKTAREEFPDYDITVRGAVSIGRRLMDPLAELVKIDPSSIGVGQYQKDVNQTALKHSLDQTVVKCVNNVGVNLNTASKHLLTYISGLGPGIAQNIVDYRTDNGAFKARKELLKVPKLGPKAYEQCAGFLRIEDGSQPLDNSAVHPESYPIVEQMAKDLNCSVKELMTDKVLRNKIDIKKYVSETVGIPTLTDIMNELDKPSREPRKQLTAFEFAKDIHDIEDISVGMIIPGKISNITNFGCFVDVGIHTKGLVHISELANKYVKDPTEIVSLHQQVMVKVIGVDLKRQRLALSMKAVGN